jgi:uncharacterized protein YqjF (DUF2071 family)
MTIPVTPLLTAEWRNLVMLNYEAPPDLLQSRVPAGTELDYWNGRTFVSIVGFRFLNARLLGWQIPFHVNFDEVNLRFYVRRRAGNEWRRGVVFVKEIAPRTAVSLVARWVYNEQYITLPMRSRIETPSVANDHRGSVAYNWKHAGRWNEVSAVFSGDPHLPANGSEAEYIIEHYWCYTAQRDGSTFEYRVEHPHWRVWPASDARLDADVAALYGPEFDRLLGGDPSSVFVVDGSSIVVRGGQKLDPENSRTHVRPLTSSGIS